jgi:hypothetical protein
MTESAILTTAQHGGVDGTRRTITVTHRRGHVTLSRNVATITLHDTEAPPPGTDDGALFGTLQHLMALGVPVHVEGRVTPRALRNAMELQTYWARWRRGRLHPVAITADERVLPGAPRPDAVALFSGGVDATFTLLRHGRPRPSAEAEPLAAALMVHGFDVPLADADGFARLVARVSPLLAERGVALLRASTDLRSALPQDWEDSHGLQLAAMLHQHADRFGIGLIGSGEPIDLATLPWGSTMATDHLMSGDAMAMRHDGGGFTRSEKIARIAAVPTALATLKVCWAGPDPARNCGVCEKCIRTRLAMRAVGADDARAFPGTLRRADIARLPLRPDIADKFDEILREAKRNGIDAPWMTALDSRLWRFRTIDRHMAGATAAWGEVRRSIAVRTRFRRLLGSGGGWGSLTLGRRPRSAGGGEDQP